MNCVICYLLSVMYTHCQSSGGAGNFITGAGGYLQTVTAGYPGMRLLPSSYSSSTSTTIAGVDLDSLSFSPMCPEFSTYMKVRSFDYLGCKFNFEYWCTGESINNAPYQVTMEILSCGGGNDSSSLHDSEEAAVIHGFTFYHYQSVTMNESEFYPFYASSVKPRDSFLLDIDKSPRVVVDIDDKYVLNRFILQQN